MRGIVGYASNQPALPILLARLRRLEYRGYDQARQLSNHVAAADGCPTDRPRNLAKSVTVE